MPSIRWAAMRLTPYRDKTVPKVLAVSLKRRGTLLDLSAEAIDMPSLPVPGRWHGFPVSPALVTWRIESNDGRVVVGPRVARDVRRLVPKNDRFWSTFARGTHQNWPVFDGNKERFLAGPTCLGSRRVRSIRARSTMAATCLWSGPRTWPAIATSAGCPSASATA